MYTGTISHLVRDVDRDNISPVEGCRQGPCSPSVHMPGTAAAAPLHTPHCCKYTESDEAIVINDISEPEDALNLDVSI